MEKITEKWLKRFGACLGSIEWVKEQKTSDPIELLEKGIASNDDTIFDYCNWGISRYFSRIERIKYTVYVAKQVLHIFEKEYPDDDRPRKAIEAAERCVKNDTEENRHAAYNAAYAAYATYTATYAAANAAYDAYAAAYNAASAAYATYNAASAAYAAYDAYAAAYNAASAAYATHAAAKIKIKILKYGMKLLKARNNL